MAIAKAIIIKASSRSEICQAIGMAPKHTDNIKAYVDEFYDAGLIYIESWTARYTEVFAWQPMPFALPDAPRPTTKEAMQRQRGVVARLEREALA